MFQAIRNFSTQLNIKEEGGTIVGTNPTISFFSLDKRQKAAAITLLVVSMIMISIGATSLAGSNIMETSASWAILGSGLGISTITVGFMIFNHLLLIKEVAKFLAARNFSSDDWCSIDNIKNYPDNVPAQVIYAFSKFRICGQTYAKVSSGGKKIFHIEFHRTSAISQERLIFMVRNLGDRKFQ